MTTDPAADKMRCLTENMSGAALAGSGNVVAEEKARELLGELDALFARADHARG